MKRIIDGRTYDTSTAKAVARTEWEEEDTGTRIDRMLRQVLHQTRGGAFFLVTYQHWTDDNRNSPSYGEECRHTAFETMSTDKASGWVMGQNIEILDETVFAAPPEAEAEETPAATIFVRLPVSLKAQCEERAKAGRTSLNAWVVQLLAKETAGSNKPTLTVMLRPEGRE
jgi:hypothetical protein